MGYKRGVTAWPAGIEKQFPLHGTRTTFTEVNEFFIPKLAPFSILGNYDDTKL